jgi:platelet-activating factor acetylhydrolase IB subunit alpha
MRDHTHYIECIAFSPAALSSIEAPDVIFICYQTKLFQGKTYKGKTGASGAFIASGSRDKSIKIWETATGQCVMTLVFFFFLFNFNNSK